MAFVPMVSASPPPMIPDDIEDLEDTDEFNNGLEDEDEDSSSFDLTGENPAKLTFLTFNLEQNVIFYWRAKSNLLSCCYFFNSWLFLNYRVVRKTSFYTKRNYFCRSQRSPERPGSFNYDHQRISRFS
jgi:hypothetical protein